MRGADMLDVVFVEIGLQRDARLPQLAMILRPRKRGQDKELDHVEREFSLNDRYIAPYRLRSVSRKAQYITGERDDALRLPGEQHPAVLGDLVLALVRGREVVGIDVFEPDEDPGDAGPLRLLNEIRDLVTQRVDLDHQPERDAVILA